MWKTALKKNLSCLVEENKELAPLSALGVGGVAEVFVSPASAEDIRGLFRTRAEHPFPLYVLGGGTNVVFNEGLLEGVVLCMREMKNAEWDSTGEKVVLNAEAGVPFQRVVAEAAANGLAGCEFAAGIPGTLGGALAGNAGAGGRSIGDLVVEATTVESDGKLAIWPRGTFECAYRFCSLAGPDRVLVGCKLSFSRAPREEVEKEIACFRQARSFQPRGGKSAGCTFKNPPQESAGRLLDVCGCKGLKVGNAVVSDDHANFILNRGEATGSDIFELTSLCRDIVLSKTGVRLEAEIKFIGFDARVPSL